MYSRRIVVLRYGHRPVRDKRVSTHLALVARAFGAQEIWFDTRDEKIEKRISQVNRMFGGNFVVRTGINWNDALNEARKIGFCIVHLTMYGIPLPQVISDLKLKNALLIIVGGPKVPRIFYDLADYNISITNQPHSEVAALAVFLDWLHEGREFNLRFNGGRLEIVPCERGKMVKVKGGTLE